MLGRDGELEGGLTAARGALLALNPPVMLCGQRMSEGECCMQAPTALVVAAQHGLVLFSLLLSFQGG